METEQYRNAETVLREGSNLELMKFMLKKHTSEEREAIIADNARLSAEYMSQFPDDLRK